MGLRGIGANPLSRRGPASASKGVANTDAPGGPQHFSAEVLALFVELEREIDAGLSRGDREFRQRSYVLARQLGLIQAWLTVDDVFDRSTRPCHPPSYLAHNNWHKCRAVRLALLAAVADPAA